MARGSILRYHVLHSLFIIIHIVHTLWLWDIRIYVGIDVLRASNRLPWVLINILLAFKIGSHMWSVIIMLVFWYLSLILSLLALLSHMSLRDVRFLMNIILLTEFWLMWLWYRSFVVFFLLLLLKSNRISIRLISMLVLWSLTY